MATSPSDQNNRNVLAWLDRLQSSVRDAGSRGGPGAFLNLRSQGDDDSDVESEAHKKPFGVLPSQEEDDSGGDCVDGVCADVEKLLPDSHVPLGLIANLSLSNSKAKKKNFAKDGLLNEEDLDDDNVVCIFFDALFYGSDVFVLFQRALRMIRTLCLVSRRVDHENLSDDRFVGPATDLGIRATLIEQHSPPEILVHGLVTPEDVEKLFQMCVPHPFNMLNTYIYYLQRFFQKLDVRRF